MALSARLLDPKLLFQFGLGARLLLVFCVFPDIQRVWFLPFVEAFIRHPSLDPWTDYLTAGGDTFAFPYGPVMLIVHSIPVAFGMALDSLFGSQYFSPLGFRLSLLSADMLAMYFLRSVHDQRRQRALVLFWLSPVCLYITYFHGQTDIVPVALLITHLQQLRKRRGVTAGVLLGLACVAKFSMVLAIPFVLVYLWRNRRVRVILPRFFAALTLCGTFCTVPYVRSPGYLTMALGSPVADGVYQFAMPLGEHFELYLTPLCYMLLLYFEWRIGRINFDLLLATIGIGFTSVVILTPPRIGWYLWILPFLPSQRSDQRITDFALNSAFAVTLIGLHVFISSGASVAFMPELSYLPWTPDTASLAQHHGSIALTLIVTLGIVLTLRLLRDGVANNDYYRLSRAPLTIGIAGDSSVGKDTLALSLAGLFGHRSAALVSGDDYHRWERQAPMWKAITHLDPRANDLQAFEHDVRWLREGRSVMCRRYDHSTGLFTTRTRLECNDAVLVSGLHTLYQPELCKHFDLKVYLEVDEELRRAWKVARDTNKRGHSPDVVIRSIERRAPDRERFIAPQRHNADVVLRVEPVKPYRFSVHAGRYTPAPKRLCVRVELAQGLFAERLSRVLVGLIGAHVDSEILDQPGRTAQRIEGEFDADDIALAASRIIPNIEELLDLSPRWQGGIAGIMQLVVVAQVSEAVRRRGHK
jgi:uridine kinase